MLSSKQSIKDSTSPKYTTSRRSNDDPHINDSIIEQFDSGVSEKEILFSMFSQWNCNRTSTDLCTSWTKPRPSVSSENLRVLLWNGQFLSTHMSEFDSLLSFHLPHIFILTGVGKQTRALKPISNYTWHTQLGSNSFGGVAVLIHQRLISSVEDGAENVILLKIEILNEKIYIGSVYAPPNHTPTLHLFAKHKDKEIYLFGDFNAKHPHWNCANTNASGARLYQ